MISNPIWCKYPYVKRLKEIKPLEENAVRAKVTFPDGRTKEREVHGTETSFPYIYYNDEIRVPVIRISPTGYAIKKGYHWLYQKKTKKQIDA